MSAALWTLASVGAAATVALCRYARRFAQLDEKASPDGARPSEVLGRQPGGAPAPGFWEHATPRDQEQAAVAVRMLVGDVNGRRVRLDARGRIVHDTARGELRPFIHFRVADDE